MRPFSLLLLLAVMIGLLPTGGPLIPVAAARPAQPAVAAPVARLVLGGVAQGGQLRLLGYGFQPNQGVALRLMRSNGTQAASLGTAQASATGLIPRQTMALPAGLVAGAYAVEAINLGAVAVLLARTELQIWPAPVVELRPSNGPPGTEVRVTVRNLVPGTLRLDMAGKAVIGPVPTRAGTFTGSFIVPDNTGVAPDSVAPVVASNAVGDRLVGRAEARFVMRGGTGRPTFRLEGITVAPPELRRGEPFTITGRISPTPAGAYANVRVAPYWARRGGSSLPLQNAATMINADGTFSVTGTVPSILQGDAIIARQGDRIGISLVPEVGPAVSYEMLATMSDGLVIPFSVQVRKDKPGAADDKQPVPNTPANAIIVDIEPVGSMGLLPEEISNSLSLSDGSFVLDMATINSILGGQQLAEEIEYLNDRINGCFIQTTNIPRWEWTMGVEETILVSNAEMGGFQLPGLPTLPGMPGVGGQGLAAQAQDNPGQLDPGEVLVQVFKVTVDAAQVVDASVNPAQKGYGFVNAENKAIPTINYFVHIPSQGRTFLIGADGNTAAQVAYPAPIDLPPLPLGWGTTHSVGELRVADALVPPGTNELGKFYSFRSPGNQALFNSITFAPSVPMTVSVRLNSSLPPAQNGSQNVFFEFRGVDYPATKEYVYNGFSRCQDVTPPPPVVLHVAGIPVPGDQINPGVYPLKIKLGQGSNATLLRTVNLVFEDYQGYSPWFVDPDTTQRRVQWRPWDSRLTAVPESSSSSANGNMPHAGQQQSSLGLDAEVTTALNRYGAEVTRSTSGGLSSQAMNNAGAPLNFSGSPSAQSLAQGVSLAGAGVVLAGDQGPELEVAQDRPSIVPQLTLGLQSQPEYDEQVSILDTGYIPITGFAYGIPGIASISLSIDFRVQATAAYGVTADLGVNTLLDSNVAVRVKAEVDILLGLASAEIAFIPNVGVQIPSQFRWAASPIDLDKCFYYSLDVSWTIDVLWGAIDVADGSTTIFDGDSPGGCRQNVGGLGAQASVASADTPMPQANPAIAGDGLGRVLKVWRDTSGQIRSSELVNGAWKPAQLVTTQGRHGDPQVAFIAPGRAVAVWSKSGLGAAPAAGATLADILRQQHLAFAVWDNGVWSAPQDLTTPSTGDGKVALAACQAGLPGCPAGGAVTAAWVRDAVGDVAQRQFRIFSAIYQGGAWSAPEPVDPASGAADAEPVVIYRGAQPVVAWVRDADRDINTLGDRRLALRDLSAAAVVVPAELPAGITRPGVAIDASGALQLAFTVARQQDGPFSNRQALHRAVGACAAGLSCSWSVEEQKDALGRSLYAESPVVTMDDVGSVVITYRAMGFGPIAPNGQPLSQVPETVGTLTGAGELAQLELPATLGGGAGLLPSYLTTDGAVNWRPVAVYDPLLNSVIALAVKGPSPSLSAATQQAVDAQVAEELPADVVVADEQAADADAQAVDEQAADVDAQAVEEQAADVEAYAADAEAQAAPVTVGADPALVSVVAPRRPDFAIAGVALGGQGSAGLPLSARVRVHNRGDDWTAAGAAPLVVTATWDGVPGVGQPAGQATVSELRAGGVAEVRLELKAPQDTVNRQRTLVISVNASGAIAEVGAGDNVRRIPVGGLPTPDDVQGTARAGAASAALSWAPSADSRVIGYRVYRLDEAGGRIPVGSSYAAGWVDPTAEPGNTYQYVVTSFGTDMVESRPSVPVTLTVPGIAQARDQHHAIYFPYVQR